MAGADKRVIRRVEINQGAEMAATVLARSSGEANRHAIEGGASMARRSTNMHFDFHTGYPEKIKEEARARLASRGAAGSSAVAAKSAWSACAARS